MGKNDVIEIVRKYKELVLPELHDDFLKTSSLLWSLTWDVNTLIEPVLIDARYPSPLYEDVIATGIAV